MAEQNATAQDGENEVSDFDPITVTIDPAADAKGKTSASGDEVSAALAKVNQQLEEQRAHVAREAAARQDAERRAAESDRRLQESRAGQMNAQMESLKAAKEQASAKMQAALEAGDYKAHAAAMAEFNRADYQTMRLEEHLQQQGARPAAQDQQRTQQPQRQVADPVEAYAAALSPTSAAWIRAHPEFVRDKALNDKMVRADSRAFGEGLERDTPEYFARVEQLLGLRQAEAPKADDPPPPKPVRAQAPVARDTSQSLRTGESRQRTITLTPEMRATARDLGMSEEAYARQLLAAQQDGQLTVVRI